VHPKGANSMAVSRLVCSDNLLGTGRATSVHFGINGVRNKRSHLVVLPFPMFKARLSATAGWHFSRVLIGSLLIGGCGSSHVSTKESEIMSGSSCEPNNPREQKLGYV